MNRDHFRSYTFYVRLFSKCISIHVKFVYSHMKQRDLIELLELGTSFPEIYIFESVRMLILRYLIAYVGYVFSEQVSLCLGHHFGFIKYQPRYLGASLMSFETRLLLLGHAYFLL